MNWSKVLGGAAPTIATMLGGPLAGGAVSILSKAVFGREDATEQDVYDAISADPEAMAKVGIAEIEARTAAQKLDVVNTQGARDMYLKTGDKTISVLTYAIVLGFFGVVAGILLSRFEDSNRELLYLIVGYVAGDMKTVLNFHFGSSKGSRDKDTRASFSS